MCQYQVMNSNLDAHHSDSLQESLPQWYTTAVPYNATFLLMSETVNTVYIDNFTSLTPIGTEQTHSQYLSCFYA